MRAGMDGLRHDCMRSQLKGVDLQRSPSRYGVGGTGATGGAAGSGPVGGPS